MDFNKETNIAIEKVIAEKLPQMIEDKTTKMIEDIVSDIFRWGNVKDSIKTKIEESINVNLQKFDLIDYNSLIAKTINENLVQQINLQPIIDMTQDIIGFVNKKEISLEDIAQLFIDASMEENDQESDGEITFLVKQDDRYKWIEVSADIEPDKDDYQCSFRFIFSTDKDRNGQIFSFRTREPYFNDNQRKISPSRLVYMDKLESSIFRLYSAQVKITNYDDSIDVNWSRYY